MTRIAPNKSRFERMDLMLVLALGAVVSSYALGFRLDWTEGQAWPEGEETEAAAVAAPASASATPAPASAPAPRVQPEMKAAPQPAWAPLPDPRDQVWDRMVRELGSQAARHPGRVAVFIKDLQTGRSWSYHPDDLFPSASLIKVPVMASVFYRIQEGELGLKQRLTLRRRLRVAGSGSLKWQPEGSRFSVDELLVHMIRESDNTATSMLLEELGMGYAQKAFPKMGLLYTGIYPEGMSIRGGRVAHENYTTAREMSMLMERIYKGELVDKDSSGVMLDILKRPKAVASRLAKGLPRGWQIAHKTGLLRQACHDTAIVFSPYGDYVITVLTGQNGSYGNAKDFITRIGRVTARHYEQYAKVGRPGEAIAKAPEKGPRRVALR